MSGRIICAITNCCQNLSAKADEIVAAITGSTRPDYSTLLNQLLTAVQAVDANTDEVEQALTDLNVTSTANAASNLAASNTLTSVLAELQAVNANTDEAETLLTQIRDLLNNPPNQPTMLVPAGDACTTIGGDTTTTAIRNRFYVWNTITNQRTGVQWYDQDDTLVTGAVEVTADADCPCS